MSWSLKLTLALLGLAVVAAPGDALAAPGRAAERNPFADELIVRLAPGALSAGTRATFSAALDNTGGLESLSGLVRTYRVRAWSRAARDRTLAALARAPGVTAVQLNYHYRASATPNDPQFVKQWNLTQVRAHEAWDLDTTPPVSGGDPSVVVAVLDTGFTAGTDFDSSRVAAGYDYASNPNDSNPKDDNGHGTHVAATIVELTDNGQAAAGIAFNSTLLPVKVLDAAGLGSTATIAQGITFAKDHGADVINLSLGGNSDDAVLHSAVTDAKNAGIVLVGATGNDGVATIGYPARYDEVIAVSAVRYDQTRAAYANIGTGLDLVAPGGDLAVDQDGNGDPDGILQQTCTTSACSAFGNYYYVGTSQASPHVAAAVALFLAAGGAPSQAQSVLQTTAKDLGDAGYDTTYGYGFLDIRAALEAVISDALPPTGSVTINGGATTVGATNVIVTLDASDASGVASMKLSNDGLTYSAPQAFAATIPWDLADLATGGTSAEGTHTVSAIFTDTKGNVSAPASDAIILDRAGPTDVRITGYTTRARHRTFSDGDPVTFPKPYFTMSATDPAGIEGYHVRWTTKPSEDPAVKGEFQTGNAFIPPRAVRVGTWYLLVRAQDKVGNASAIASFTFRRRSGFVVAPDETATSLSAYRIAAPDEASAIARLAVRERRGASLAAGDLDRDGRSELVVATARGRGEVRILSSSGKLIRRLEPFGPGFKRGLSVAVGNLDSDPELELAVVPATGTTEVRLLDADGTLLQGFASLPNSYQGGGSLAVADLDGDSVGEIIVAPLRKRSDLLVLGADGVVRRTLRPFGAARHGVAVAVGDLEADGQPDVLAVSSGNGCRVKILSATGSLRRVLTVFPDRSAGGCRIAVGDVDGDGRDEFIVSATTPTAAVRVLETNGRVLGSFAGVSDRLTTTFLVR